MTTLEKAAFMLRECNLDATEKLDSVYIMVDDYELEISEREINFWAERYDNEHQNSEE